MLSHIYKVVTGKDFSSSSSQLQRLRGDRGIETRHVDELAGIVHQEDINILMKKIRHNSFSELQEVLESLMAAGYTATQILSQVD